MYGLDPVTAGDLLSIDDCCGVPWGVAVDVSVTEDELEAFMGIEGVCDNCDDELDGSGVWSDIADGLPATLPLAGFGFARLRGPMAESSSKKTQRASNMRIWMRCVENASFRSPRSVAWWKPRPISAARALGGTGWSEVQMARAH